MCSYRVLACALMTGLMVGGASAQTPGIYGFRDIETRVAVRLAVEGAAARLARPGCQDVFADFEDESGQLLSTKLATNGQRPLDAFGRLRFLDDRGAPRCRWGGTLAFTQTGASSILVCGDAVQTGISMESEVDGDRRHSRVPACSWTRRESTHQPSDHGTGQCPMR